MTEPAATPGSGELIVRNGRHRGERFPLAVPVTVLGSDRRADVRITGSHVADVHCLLAVTPAGLTVRSWHPDDTLVNGVPTAATVLADGDELRVGPCVFQVVWHPDPLPLEPADEPPVVELAAARPDPDEAVELLPVADDLWELRQREDALHEQEERLTALLEDRQRRLTELHRQLTDGRETLRQERQAEREKLTAARDRVRQMRADVTPLHRAAKADRRKARKLLARVVRRGKELTAAAERSVRADRVELDRRAAELAARVARHQADADATHRRLQEACDALTEGQRRLLADRRQAEETAAEIRDAADRRVAAAEQRARTFEAGRERVEARVQELIAEVGRLEARATHARAAVQELEARRAKLEADLSNAAVSSHPHGPVTHVVGGLPDLVPLDRRIDRGPDDFLRELTLRERELDRDRRALVRAQAEVQTKAAAVYDDRAVLAEQVAGLAVARETWRAAELRAVADLEAAAAAVHAWEQALDLRQKEADRQDARRRRQAEELWQLRVRLEGWEAALTNHEAAAAADRAVRDADLDEREARLARWEAGLTDLAARWADARRRDRDELLVEIGRWTTARAKLQAKEADLDRVRDAAFAAAAQIAAREAAVEEVRQELEAKPGKPGAQAKRRLRLLVKRWDRRFTSHLAALDARRAALAAETAAAEGRLIELHRAAADAADARAAVEDARFAAETRQLVREREVDEQAAVIHIEEARRRRTEQELMAARDEVGRLALAVMGAEPESLPPPAAPLAIVPLRAA